MMNGTNVSNATLAQMIQTHPQRPWLAHEQLAQAVATLEQCATVCTSCADACLAEQHVHELISCIRLNLDCADICRTTAAVVVRLSQPDLDVLRSLIQACHTVCQRCGRECEQHADMHEHCRICADMCHACEQVCEELLQSL
jgi:hypothetical protein